jgi:hypothetical protein
VFCAWLRGQESTPGNFSAQPLVDQPKTSFADAEITTLPWVHGVLFGFDLTEYGRSASWGPCFINSNKLIANKMNFDSITRERGAHPAPDIDTSVLKPHSSPAFMKLSSLFLHALLSFLLMLGGTTFVGAQVVAWGDNAFEQSTVPEGLGRGRGHRGWIPIFAGAESGWVGGRLGK